MSELNASGGEKRATLFTAPAWSLRVRMILPVPRSHNLTVESQLPERARVPSAEKATPLTAAVWPLRVRMMSPVPRSHSLTVLSALPERARVPLANRATL